jgi:L-asparaginase II
VPLRSFALGFARMATGTGLGPERTKAAKRLLAACMAEPFLVAGTGRADVALMRAAPGRIFTKIGAEGVYCAALPELGLGIALKCDDGAGRAAQAVMAATIARFLPLGDVERAALMRFERPTLRNWNGFEVGSLRVIDANLTAVKGGYVRR